MNSIKELEERINEIQKEQLELRKEYLQVIHSIAYEKSVARQLKRDILETDTKHNKLMNEYLSCKPNKIQATKLGSHAYITGRTFPNPRPAGLTHSI